MWFITPPSILFAQNFLSPEVCDYVLRSTADSVSNAGLDIIQLWSPFFNLVAVVIGVSLKVYLAVAGANILS
jgi:hypothetical protein